MVKKLLSKSSLSDFPVMFQIVYAKYRLPRDISPFPAACSLIDEDLDGLIQSDI